MTKTSKTIVFFGSGPVAAASLALLARSFQIEAVITKPRPPHHKGSVPTLELAEQLHLPIITATNKKELSLALANQSFISQVAVLIDFGIIVSQDVIDTFPLGIINSHFSLLPQLRGADPITFAILEGLSQTGVSLMLLVESMDEGPLLAQAPYDIADNVTTPKLTEKLIEVSATALETILPEYINGTIQPVQQTGVPTYSRKLTKEDGILDFTKPALQLEREIRAYQPWPKSHATIAGKEVVITCAHVVPGDQDPGQISTIQKELYIGTANGILVIDRLKPAGKSEMTTEAFLAGYGQALRKP